MLQGLKMKKLLLFSLPAMFACGTDTHVQTESFAAQEIIIPRAAVCENLDASVREDMDAGKYEELCGHPKICTEFETEMVCEGEWCITYSTCRLK